MMKRKLTREEAQEKVEELWALLKVLDIFAYDEKGDGVGLSDNFLKYMSDNLKGSPIEHKDWPELSKDEKRGLITMTLIDHLDRSNELSSILWSRLFEVVDYLIFFMDGME